MNWTPFNHLILCCPLLLPPSIFPSIRVFPNESTLRIRWPKHWSFSFSISPSNEYSGLISFRINWFDLLSVQGTFKSLLQHHNLKASILQHSAFFTVQLSHPYMTTGKTIALTLWTFVSKMMSLFFNTLSRFSWYLIVKDRVSLRKLSDTWARCRREAGVGRADSPGLGIPPGPSCTPQTLAPGRGYSHFFCLTIFYLLIWLHQVLFAACRIFGCSIWTLSCSTWDLVPWPEIELGPPELEACSADTKTLTSCKKLTVHDL